jgi:hypothetical protein
VIHHIIPPNDEIETTLHEIHDDEDDESDSSYQPSDHEDIGWVGDFEENDDITEDLQYPDSTLSHLNISPPIRQSKIFLKQKLKPDGTPDKFKARLDGSL